MDRTMYLYECTGCILVFAVEEAFDGQSEIRCPNCVDENNLEERGYGQFTLLEGPDEGGSI